MTQLPDLTKLPWPEGCHLFLVKDGAAWARSTYGCKALGAMSHEDAYYACLAAAEWFRVQAEAWYEHGEKELDVWCYFGKCEDQWRSAALQCERAMTEVRK